MLHLDNSAKLLTLLATKLVPLVNMVLAASVKVAQARMGTVLDLDRMDMVLLDLDNLEQTSDRLDHLLDMVDHPLVKVDHLSDGVVHLSDKVDRLSDRVGPCLVKVNQTLARLVPSARV